MNPCSEDILIGPYHDDELDEQAALRIEKHLGSCGPCAAHLAELRRVSDRLSGVPLDAITPMEQMRIVRVVDGLQLRLAERAMMRMAIGLAALAATLLIVTSLWLSGVRRGADATAQNYKQVAVLLPPQSDQARSNLSHWMVRNLGGELP
jgi:anti-sigma factor RsiW